MKMGAVQGHTIHNSSTIGNDSIDVMCKGCFNNFDTIACIRNGVMVLLVVVTLLLCCVKIIRLHVGRHPQVHQYIIFYCAAFECAICAVHWLLESYAQLDFIMQYLKLIVFLVVTHFYWRLASRVMRKEKVTNRVLIPVFVIAVIYFSVVCGWGMVDVTQSWLECFQPYWILLSSAEFVLVQLFMLAAFYISRRLNEISTLETVRRSQKRDLWAIVIVFEVSAAVGLIYDFTLKTVGDAEGGCSGVFLHRQEIYSPVFGVFMVVKFLLPIWIMLFIFHPIEVASDQEDLLPGVSEDGNYTSVFSPPERGSRYKPLYTAGSGPMSSEYQPYDSPSASPNSSQSSTPTAVSTIRRISSNLQPIREENASIN